MLFTGIRLTILNSDGGKEMVKIALVLTALTFLMSCGSSIKDAQNFIPNEPPEMESITIVPQSGADPAKLTSGMHFSVTVKASDPERSTLRYEFTSTVTGSDVSGGTFGSAAYPNGNGECNVEFVTGAGADTPGAAVDVIVSVIDAKGAVVSQSKNIGTGRMGPQVTVFSSPATINDYGSATLSFSVNVAGFYQILERDTRPTALDDTVEYSHYAAAGTTVSRTIKGAAASGVSDTDIVLKNNGGSQIKRHNIWVVFTDNINPPVAQVLPYNVATRSTPADPVFSTVTTIAGAATMVGGGTPGYTEGIGTASRFKWPKGITSDGIDLYVVDYGNNVIRKISYTGGQWVTSLFAGVPGNSGYKDGDGSSALFYSPAGICTDGLYLYVSDQGNNRVRRISIATGEVYTVAGDGTKNMKDGIGTNASLGALTTICTDMSNLYVMSISGTYYIHKIDIGTTEVRTIAGEYTKTTGICNAIAADANYLYRMISGESPKFYVEWGEPASPSFNRKGMLELSGGATSYNLYVTTSWFIASFSQQIQVISRVDRSLPYTIIGSSSGFTDGAISSAQFSTVLSCTTIGTRIFVADTYNSAIRMISN